MVAQHGIHTISILHIIPFNFSRSKQSKNPYTGNRNCEVEQVPAQKLKAVGRRTERITYVPDKLQRSWQSSVAIAW